MWVWFCAAWFLTFLAGGWYRWPLAACCGPLRVGVSQGVGSPSRDVGVVGGVCPRFSWMGALWVGWLLYGVWPILAGCRVLGVGVVGVWCRFYWVGVVLIGACGSVVTCGVCCGALASEVRPGRGCGGLALGSGGWPAVHGLFVAVGLWCSSGLHVVGVCAVALSDPLLCIWLVVVVLHCHALAWRASSWGLAPYGLCARPGGFCRWLRSG